MYIVTTNSKGQAAVYEANADEAKLFEDFPEKFPEDMSGWVIEDAGDLASQMSKPQMVAVYNNLSGESLVKFQNKDVGAQRTFPYVQRFAKPFDELLGQSLEAVPLKGKVEIDEDETTEAAPEADKPKATRRGRQDRGIHDIPPKERAVACRPGTKQQLLIDTLAEGASMAKLIEVMGSIDGLKPWTESSVKSGFYHDVNTLKGYGVRTEVVVEGEPDTYIYHLVLPEGLDEPLAPKKSKAAEAKEKNDA